MSLCERLLAKTETLAVVGMGYVGLPIAVSFSESVNVIGYDVNAAKIQSYLHGIDVTNEVGDEALSRCSVDFTADETRLADARFVIVAVPTPVDEKHQPDLSLLREATQTVGRHLQKGSIVVYESTVYPGVTREICVPLLEATSGLRCGVDFAVGYSPERINPGDQTHRLDTIVKVVSAIDEPTLCEVAAVYGLVAKAGVYRAPSIEVAETAKVIENCQRDINIAFVNEIAMLCHHMHIDSGEVLSAAATKWNFLPFTPGLVGGHCVGVDPYYLTERAKQLGFECRMIAAGRHINDGMGQYVAAHTIKCLLRAGVLPTSARAAIFGLTFKEDCPDIRNTRVVDIYRELSEYGVSCTVTDVLADSDEVMREYGFSLTDEAAVCDADVVIVAVPHQMYRTRRMQDFQQFYHTDSERPRILVDVKGVFDRAEWEAAGYLYWRL